jgi:CSLREA domain-containing protein
MLIAAAAALVAPAGAGAATIPVTTVNDEIAGDADCSLREAVQSARDNAADTTGCVNGDAATVDTIVLNATTYTLDVGDQVNPTNENSNQTGDLDFSGGDVVVRGAGRSATSVTTTLNDRVFDASTIDTTTLTLESLTVEGGTLALALAGESGGNVRLRDGGHLVVRDAGMVDGAAQTGGAIDAHADVGAGEDTGSITIEDSEIEVNSAAGWGGALNADGGMAVRIERSTFGSNTVAGSGAQVLGGAISNMTESFVGGSMTITDSLFIGNEVVNLAATENAVGGAIRNRGPLTVRGSLFMDNRVNTVGEDDGSQNGGALWFESGTGTITNSTIYDNEAGSDAGDEGHGGGVFVNSGNTTLNHVTFSANDAMDGGDSLATGSLSSGSLSVGRSIIPGTGVLLSDPCEEGGHQITSVGFNIASANDGGCGYVATDSTSGSLGFVPGGPQDNGGATPTIALEPDSRAVGHVPAAACSPAGGVDQRGVSRPQGLNCDAGAYELDCPTPQTRPDCFVPQVAVPPKCGGRPATIVGTPGADALRGTPKADVILALGGKDKVRALGGNDVVCGGPAKDKLFGGGGRDRLLGQGGRDLLVGGKGKDKLVGGKGRDAQKQ